MLVKRQPLPEVYLTKWATPFFQLKFVKETKNLFPAQYFQLHLYCLKSI